MEKIQKPIELIKKSTTYKLIIPEFVESKIRFLCQKVHDVEWSGTLFYKPEGKFEDGTLVIRCVDIYVMDIGTATYTEFDMSPDVISYMTDNPELLDCQMGLIHSHNNMSTFFSGTDTATLRAEGTDRNHFVSLIVNNEGTYTAAITRKISTKKVIQEDFSYPTFGGNIVSDHKTYEVENEEIEYYYLNIEFEGCYKEFYLDLNNRLKDIKGKKFNTSTLVCNNTNYKQEPLFVKSDNSLEKSSKSIKRYYDTDYIDSLSVTNYPAFDPELIKHLTLQLLTCSIIIPNTSKIDINNWVKKMDILYENRFGKGEYGLKMFKAWADGFIEYLCWFSYDDKLIELGVDDDESASLCARGIINELNKFPKNKYINVYIDILEGYLI